MNEQLAAIVTEVRTLATQRHWADVQELGEQLRAAPPSPVLLAVASGVEAAGTARWVAEAAPGAAPPVQPLETLGGLAALRAEKLLAVFTCGALLEAPAVDAVKRLLFSRPASSYAVVLAGAEEITNPAELDFVESGAWRLLVPHPAHAQWAGQDLLAHRCHFWAAAEGADFLRPRLRRDQEALATWLRSTGTDNGMDRRRVAALLDLAEAHTRDRGTATDAALRSQRIAHARDAVADLRRRLLPRLDAAASLVEQELTTSLRSLGQDMAHELPGLLDRGAPTAEELPELVGCFVRDTLHEWSREAAAMWGSRHREVLGDLEGMLHGIDWALVNECAAGQRAGRTYPEAFFQGVDAGLPPAVEVPGNGGPGEGPPRRDRDLVSLLPTALASAAVMAVMHVAGMQTAVAAAGGGVAAVASEILGHFRRGRDSRQDQLDYGRAQIHAVVGRAVEGVGVRTRQAAGALRERLAGEIEAVEKLLDRALRESRQPAEPEAAGDRAAIDGWRRRLGPEGR
jgi:hypothetical protein